MSKDERPGSREVDAASVDPAEVEYYTRLAEFWWDDSGAMWPIHTLNRLRTTWILERIAPVEGLRVLDIGCGGGLLAEALARAGAEVVGVDVTAKNIEVARLHAAASGLVVDYRHTTAEALAEAGERFDVVLNMEVVEHVADLPGFMDACTALVADGGHMFVATLNRTVAGLVVGIIGAEYVLGLLPIGTHQWERFVKPRELARHLDRGGLEVVERTGVRVNPVSRRMALTRWLGVNYMVHARRR
jgi:2-polyprenyl-6-hydroxyphenyl methylase/3-demethylubiquinone-9 3-methyltransferase